MGEGPGGGGTAIGPDTRLADDGKRCFSGGRCVGKLSVEKGESSREGGTAVGPYGRLADYGKCFSTRPFVSSFARSRLVRPKLLEC